MLSFAYCTLDLAPGVALCYGLAFIVELLTTTKPQLDLCPPSREVELKWNERHTFRRYFIHQLVDFAPV